MASDFRTERLDGGLELIRLQNDCVGLAVAAATGGKILELIDRRSGRNWLWKNPHIPLSLAQRGADFAREQDSGGWDEVLLSVKPGKVRALSDKVATIPDHGDLIGSEWSVDELQVTDAGDVVCVMSVLGNSAAYRFERQIRLPHAKASVEIRYRFRNDSDESLPWFWCAHPLLAVEPDARIEIDGKLQLRVDDLATQDLVDGDSEQHWPNLSMRDGSSLDLSRCFRVNGAQQLASKLFVRSPNSGVASLSLADGRSQLIFRYDPDELPWMGLWINNAAWSGVGSEPYTNLGLEPSTTPYDCVNQAIENEAVPWLEAGGERTWSLAVELRA